MAKNSQEEPNDCKPSIDLVDLSDTFLNNCNHNVQNHSDTDLKGRKDCEKQETIDDPDVSLSKSKLISEQENDPKLHPLLKLLLPPVELGNVPESYYVRKWRLPNVHAAEKWSVIHQTVIPKLY